MDENVIKPLETDPFQKELEAFWRETGKDLVRGSIKTIDETAKQIIAVSGILEGLYFHAITFANLRGHMSSWSFVIYAAPLLLLLVSLTAALAVFIPGIWSIELRAWKA